MYFHIMVYMCKMDLGDFGAVLRIFNNVENVRAWQGKM